MKIKKLPSILTIASFLVLAPSVWAEVGLDPIDGDINGALTNSERVEPITIPNCITASSAQTEGSISLSSVDIPLVATSVPEPSSTLAMLGLTGSGLFAIRKRKVKSES